MSQVNQLFIEEETQPNEMKGFTKTFVRKTKEKKEGDLNIKEILLLKRENKLIYGAKMTQKAFKNGRVKKVFAASNCEEIVLKKVEHYAKISGVGVVMLKLSNYELAERLGKPFLISMTYEVSS